MKYIVICLILLFCFSSWTQPPLLSPWAQPPLPYQNCNTVNEKFTQKITQDVEKTEAGFCFFCKRNTPGIDTMQIVQSIEEIFTDVIPKKCFLAMAARGNQLYKEESKRYKYCHEKNSRSITHHRKLCINEQYINMVHKAFHTMSKCFDFDKDKQAEILGLINQESGGVLNVASSKGARCLGQLTKDYVVEINRHIKSRKWKEPLKHSEIYDEVVQRCPTLNNLVLSSKEIKKDNAYLTCQLTQDPDTCLFYTFLGLEKNHRQMKESLQSKSNYMGSREFTPSEKDKFQLPIKLNEMLNVTVKFKGETVKWTFWDDSELYDVIKKNEDRLEVLEVQKVLLFQEEKHIETIFNYWGHNGGGSYTDKRMVAMVERLKRSMARSCSDSEKRLRCRLRKSIQNGESLSATQALSFFEKDLEANYPSEDPNRRNEVAYYVRKILKTSQHVFGYEKNSKDTNTMKARYQRFFQFGDISLKDEEAEAFQKLVSEQCPKVDFISLKK